MNEHNDVAPDQAPSPDVDQATIESGWPGPGVTQTADPEPPQAAESEQTDPEDGGPEGTPETSSAEPPAADDAEAAPQDEPADAPEADAEPADGTEATAEGETAAAEDATEEPEAAGDVADAGDEAEAEVVDGGDVAEVAAEAEVVDGTEAGDEAEAGDVAEAATGGEEPESEAADDLTAEHLIDPGDAEGLRNGWHDVKAAFVDDPADAVRQASVLVGDAVDGLTSALTKLRENLDRQSSDADDADTERLRVVLRGYGSLLDHILTR